MKKQLLIPVVGTAALITLYFIGAPEAKRTAMLHAERCIQLNGDSDRCDKVSKTFLDDDTRTKYEVAMRSRAALQKANQEKADAEAARQVQAESEARAAIASAKAEADAKFKAQGWFQLQPGIYGRWCTQTCSNADVIGDASYWLMEVWCKDRSCGDIYAQINIVKDGTAIGWTNDTAYLSRGQKGILTFSKHLPESGGQYNAELVKFNVRG